MDLLVETNLNILLKLIIHTNFQNAKCVIQTIPNQNFTTLQVPVLFDTHFSSVVNPQHCIPGCSHYILHDPNCEKSSWFNTCLLQNGYHFKAIFFLENQSMDRYARKAYAANAIFISREKDDFIIKAFKDWEVTQDIVLNRWCIKTGKFLLSQYNISDFFYGRWKYNGNIIVLPYRSDVPMYQKSSFGDDIPSGSDYNILKEFAIANKFTIDNSSAHDSENKEMFIVTDNGIYQNGSIYSYPMTGIELTFIVPIPKYIDRK